MATQSRTGLQTDINADLADNTTADISPADVRGILTDINDSVVNKTTDTDLIGWYEFSATKNYYTGELVYYSNSLYKFNQNHTAGAWNAAHADLATFGGTTMFKTSVSLSSAEVLALNSSPKTAITCPTGKTIQVISASIQFGNGGTTAYATDTDVILIGATANIAQVKWTNVLDTFGASQWRMGAIQSPSWVGGDIQLKANDNLNITTPSADPTLGNLTATVHISYILLG